MSRPDIAKPPMVFDCDGVFIDLFARKDFIYRIYPGLTASVLHISRSSAEELLQLGHEMRLRHPGRNGWTNNLGQVIASAEGDPFIGARSDLKSGMDHERRKRRKKLPPREDDPKNLGQIHNLVYEKFLKRGLPIREGAEELLKEAQKYVKPVVLSNSGTHNVNWILANIVGKNPRKKSDIREVAREYGTQGGAMKHIVGGKNSVPEHPDFPKTIDVPGAKRPLYVRRPHLIQALDQIKPVAIVDDNAELALFTAIALQGIHAILMATPGETLQYEIDFFNNERLNPLGHAVQSLPELLTLIQDIAS